MVDVLGVGYLAAELDASDVARRERDGPPVKSGWEPPPMPECGRGKAGPPAVSRAADAEALKDENKALARLAALLAAAPTPCPTAPIPLLALAARLEEDALLGVVGVALPGLASI